MRIRYTTPAKQDLMAIQDYIAQDDPAAAHRLIQRIREQVENLGRHSHLGRPGKIPGTRELSISGTPYFVVYRIKQRSIEMLSVVHARRKWPR